MNARTLSRLRRVRWAVRVTLTLGVAASVAANVLHALPNPVSQVIAAWPPLALLLTVELISRVPVHRRSLAAVRLAATGIIAGIAAWVSYWHMAGVAARYGEQGASPYLLPISVDGLVLVASVSLVELAGRIRQAETPTALTVPAVPEPVMIVPSGQSTQDRPQETVPEPATVEDDQVTAGLLDRARAANVEHRTAHGRDITRDELRSALRVSNATAGELLRLVRETTRPARPPLPVPATAFTRTTASNGAAQ